MIAEANTGGTATATYTYGLRGLTPAHWHDGSARYGQPEDPAGSIFRYTGQVSGAVITADQSGGQTL